jgi:hypothetical protein
VHPWSRLLQIPGFKLKDKVKMISLRNVVGSVPCGDTVLLKQRILNYVINRSHQERLTQVAGNVLAPVCVR